MDTQKVDMFLMANNSHLPASQIPYIRDVLLSVDEYKWGIISTMQMKSPTIALLLSLFLGHLGVDRIYIGQTSRGICKLLTCGGFGIWTIIDWFIIISETKKQNYNMLCEYLNC